MIVMTLDRIFVFAFLLSLKFENALALQESGSHVCKHYAYRQEKYSTSCGFLSWSSCTKYRSTIYSYLTCCPGYRSNGYECPYPICDGKINPSACHIYYNNDVMIYRPGARSPERNSGGYCKSPEQCAGCNDGFYPDRAYCRICPRISHCKHRRCTDIPSNHCEYCDGEIVDRLYWRAYTRHKDVHGNNDYRLKNCMKTCSWRADSTRCYPGTCSNEIATTCKCLDGFGGHHCDQILKDSTILYAIAKLNSSIPGRNPIETPIDPNDPIPRVTKWTNHLMIDRAYLEVNAVFKVNSVPTAPDQTGRNHYITDFKYGVLGGRIKLAIIRDGNQTIPPIVKICHVQKQLPTNDLYQCKEPMVYLNAWMWFLPFQHNDRVIYSFDITNGGYLKYIDRDAHPSDPEKAPRKRVDLKGRTVSRQFVFHWDLVEPAQQCVKTHGMKCTVPPVFVPDITTNSTIHLQWNGWIDDLSGIETYYYEVFELGNDGMSLSEDLGKKISETSNIVRTDVMSEFSVIKIGMYSVILTAIDKAGNKKSSRTLFLYDDNSHVEVEDGKHIRVQQSTNSTKYVWVDVDDPILKVNWPGRFSNEMHYKQLWLESVKPRMYVDHEYDDHYGKRKTTTVPNRQGVVKFETQFIVSSPSITQKVNFVSTSNVLDEATSLSVQWDDGDKLDITVRAFDIFDSYIDDMVTVYKDTSPPEIENIWLFNGDRGNVSLYSGEDLLNMTIELNAFDYHSGIDHLVWRLYDNYTKSEIVHGNTDIASQGNLTNITDCHNKYGDASRGSSCYCTHFHGCFQKHVYVKLQINNDSCLNTGKYKAVNESEYYIEVTVVNKALLKTTVEKKISVDFSAPHEGYVHDGIRGHPEIDFQQDLHIDAHWEGFFDRESGVEFYQYIFSDHCFKNDEFKANNQTSKTLNTFVSFDAPTKGTYVVSVVAVNGAKESSNVVCSDGVTVMTFWQ